MRSINKRIFKRHTKKWYVIDLVNLSHELNMIEKSEEMPCGMDSVWDLLERASGASVIDDRTSNVHKKMRVNIDIVREKAYYYTRLNKQQREYLIEIIKGHEIKGDQ